MKRLYLRFCLVFVVGASFLIGDAVLTGQEGASTPPSGRAQPPPGGQVSPEVKPGKRVRSKKKKRRKSRKRRKSSKIDRAQEIAESVVDGDEVEQPHEMERPSVWFPDWVSPPFSYSISPIVGFRMTSDSSGERLSTSTTTEFGLGLGLRGIPLYSGNPGFYVGPHAAYAKGFNNVTVVDEDEEKSETYAYTRMFYGLHTSLLIRSFNLSVGINYGIMDWDDDELVDLKFLQLINDFGILLLDFASLHYTLDQKRVYPDRYKEPIFVEMDNWLHLKLFWRSARMVFDNGPGFTLIDLYNDGELFAKDNITYYKMVAGWHIFWKLSMQASAKYVFTQKKDLSSELADIRLPSEGLNDQRTSGSIPEDTMDASVFIGINDLFAGFGFGWRYNCRILHAMGKDGHRKKYIRDSGFGASYQVSF